MKTSANELPLAFVAIQAALQAGQVLRKGFGSELRISSKANPLDLVTEFDKLAEETIISFIESHFEDHGFLAEESGATKAENESVTWIIDPLDGTMNFAHQIPIFAISIAAMIKNHVEVGIVYQPLTDELFVAQKGRGAYLNGRRLFVSATSDIKLSVGATGFPYGLEEAREHSMAQFNSFLEVGNPIRIIGSAVLNLAYVAAGRFDAFWATNLKPWDVAAGKLLIEEAGGKITHYNGTPYQLFDELSIIASNGLLHETILSYLQ